MRLGEAADRCRIADPPGAPRERGCPPWVVLGVKAVEARGALHGEMHSGGSAGRRCPTLRSPRSNNWHRRVIRVEMATLA
jgi:hypothetical protein